MVAQMQRRRVRIEKIAHLQDEDGDTIRLVHPYSGQNIDIYVASLTRKFKKATADGDGYFLDEIEGWVIP
jgi:acetolactate synthase small subunit